MNESELLEDLRPRAFGIAYRMLGSASEAEDVVQEALLRVHTAIEDGQEISSPRAYAATVVTRLAIDELRSARARRETYVGEWLPEPLAAREEEPAAQAEQADSLSLAFLVVLESLTPEQRAAFLLHDVFDYGYGQVAEIVGTTEQNARQLASRARRQVHEGRPRFDPSAEQREELAAGFLAAAKEGDFEKLESFLAEDVALHGDGGGLVPAIKRPVFGRARVAQMLGNWMRLAFEKVGGVELRPATINGQPGAEFIDADGKLLGVMSLDIADGKIQAIRSVVNPEKLAHLGPVADANELLRRIRESR